MDEVEVPQVPHCKGSIDRPCRRTHEGIHLDPRQQVVAKRKGPEMQRQRFENCGKNSNVRDR